MKKITILFAAAASVMLVSCTKEQFSEPALGKATVISVSIDDETKTTIGSLSDGKRPLYWANGDQISINGLVSSPLEGVEASAKKADFTFTNAPAYPYSTLYPAAYYKDATTVTLPAVAGELPVPMAAKGLALKPVMGVLKINLNAQSESPARIASVKVTSGTQQLSGDFTIDYTNSTITGADASEAAKSVTFRTFTLLSAPLEVFIPVPAGQYDFNVTVYDSNGNYMTKSTTGPKTITAGKIANMPAFDFVPTAKKIDVQIASAAQWNEFAGKYNNNEYDEVIPLIVEVTSDLDFTGVTPVRIGRYDGDESQKKYCHANIQGNNYKISNIINGQDPLVASVDADGAICNLTIDETCTFTPDLGISRTNYFGPFTEYLRGTLNNCANRASITVTNSAEGATPFANYIGGIAGRIRDGQMVTCENSGAITVDKAYIGSESGKGISVGGIAGYISNSKGSITSCVNSGAIVADATVEPVYVGGIVGISSGKLSKCTNNAALSSAVVRESGDPCKTIYMGGVVGSMQAGSANKCKNSGNLTSNSDVKRQFFGGAVGILKGGSISGNTNSGNISYNAAVRQAIAGGLIGSLEAEGKYTFTGTPVTGSIDVNSMESGSSSYLYLGGLIGRVNNSKSIQIEGESLSYTCNISFNTSSISENFELSQGGIGGVAGASMLEIVKDTTYYAPEITGCSVTCNITTTPNGDMTFNPVNFGVGGILGQALGGAIIKNCTTSGAISVGRPEKSNSKIVDCGGIAGRIIGGDSEISGCTVKGTVTNNHYNNNPVLPRAGAATTGGNATGGIIGNFGHVDGNENTIAITNCTSSAEVFAYRCCGGGIAGYLDHATVKGCSVTGAIKNANYAGGLVGYASNSIFGGDATGEACTFNSGAGIVSTNAGSCLNYAGGLAGQTLKCSFTECRSYFGTTNGLNAKGAAGSGGAPGSLIGYSDSDTGVTSCMAGGNMYSANYGMPGDSETTEAELDDSTVESYAVGNLGIILLGEVFLWEDE